MAKLELIWIWFLVFIDISVTRHFVFDLRFVSSYHHAIISGNSSNSTVAGAPAAILDHERISGMKATYSKAPGCKGLSF